MAAEFDDGNKNWVEVEEEDEQVLEKRLRDDDAFMDGEESMPKDHASKDALLVLHHQMRHANNLAWEDYTWQWWANHWKNHIRIFKKKYKYINANRPVHPIWMYFDHMDLAVMRTLQHTAEFCDEEGWVNLPGCSRLWKRFSDEAIDWDMGEENDTLISYRLDALWMVYAKEMPNVFNELNYSMRELMVYKSIIPSYF